LSHENAEMPVPLEKCILYYIPKMIHSHREMWPQEDLIIFYPTDDKEFRNDSARAENIHREIYFCPIDLNDDVYYKFKTIVANNMQLDYTDKFPDELIPEYFIIDNKDFIEAITND
jgi:hypothetical protein